MTATVVRCHLGKCVIMIPSINPYSLSCRWASILFFGSCCYLILRKLEMTACACYWLVYKYGGCRHIFMLCRWHYYSGLFKSMRYWRVLLLKKKHIWGPGCTVFLSMEDSPSHWKKQIDLHTENTLAWPHQIKTLRSISFGH